MHAEIYLTNICIQKHKIAKKKILILIYNKVHVATYMHNSLFVYQHKTISLHKRNLEISLNSVGMILDICTYFLLFLQAPAIGA